MKLRLSAKRAVALAISAALLIAIADYLAGKEISLGIFYLLPVFFASWFAGLGAGLGLACLSVLLTILVAVRVGHPFSSALYFSIDASGTFAGHVVFAFLASRFRRAHDAVTTLNASLERQVEDRTRQLDAALRELETFAYVVAHNLRTPLRAIYGHAAILREDIPVSRSHVAEQPLRRIEANALEMSSMIDGLLAFAGLAHKALDRRWIDLDALVAEVWASLELKVEGRDIGFSVEDGGRCYGDRPLLKQVLSNLLSNAIRFTSSRPRGEVVFRHRVDGTCDVFSVADNGVGFDEQHAGRMFSLFQKLHVGEGLSGTGAGLALVQRVVERHGGRVWADGKVDRGATFYFTLPRPADRAETDA